MKKILSLLFFVSFAAFACAQDIELYGGIQQEDGSLAFKFKNNSGKTICSCSFTLVLPEGVSLVPKGKKYKTVEGDATEGMTFSAQANTAGTQYSIAVYDGEFDETAGHTIVYLPLQGTVTGTAVVSNINFADEVGTSIYRYPENSTVEIDLATAINSISAEQTKSGAIYNMAGQRVSKANKGIYVVDGKKVAVK
jgi:hypothetical protein